MKNINIKTNIMLILLAAGWLMASFSCREEQLTDRINSDAPAPAPIDQNSITVKNLPGSAIIYYRVPQDENLLYVKAVYNPAPGVTREAKASRYLDSLVVEGFARAGEHIVKLYSVGRNEKESETVLSVPVKPGTPPVLSAAETIQLEATFGGVLGSFQNDSKTPLTAVLMADTTHTGVWNQLRAFVVRDAKASFEYVDLTDTVDTDFRIYLKDRYGNMSEPKNFRLAPWYNEEIPKDTWSAYQRLTTDFITPAEDRYGIEHLWDGSFEDGLTGLFATSHSAPLFPYTFTIRLGVKAVISRLQLHHRKDYEYQNKMPKVWELWGSEYEHPGVELLDGSWFLLGRFTSSMPSGSLGTPTAEDKLFANGEGERLLVRPTDESPAPYRPVQAITMRVFEVWDGSQGGQITISEIDLYGQIKK
jgi:hypothetical protein